MTPVPDACTPVSVVIPAHNEETVIGRCLSSLQAGAHDGELEIIVVCNGCRDNTAAAARAAAPGATVLELDVASKIAALNAGDEVAGHFPRFYLDADIELSIADLRRVATALRDDGVMCAAPRPVFVLDGRPWGIRAFYDIWQDIPYHAEDMVGTGVYALSKAGRARFGAFPELTADDQFVHQLFDRSQRRAVSDARFLVHAPRTLRGLLAMRVRAYRGNRELSSSGLAGAPRPASGVRTALAKARRPALVPAVAVYAGVNLVAKGMARRARQVRWERDDSARAVAPASAVPAPGRAAGRGAPEQVHVCYVTSHYPALSHTFVMREVMGVRDAGLQVSTVSVHKADPAHLLAQADREEAGRTWNILPLAPLHFAQAHLGTLVRHPGAYFHVLGEAVAGAPPGLRGRLWQMFYFAEAVPLWSHARALGARILHAHLGNVAADVCWLASALGKAVEPASGWNWSFTMHGPTELYSTERFNLTHKVEAADTVICISDFTRSQLMYLTGSAHWGKLRVVHCGVDLDRYRYAGPAPSAGAGAGLQVLCVGRLVPQKGLEVLLEATAWLAGRGRDVRVKLVGAGPLEASLREKAAALGVADRVDFAGAVGQDEMPRCFAEADVFCLPSFAEGVPVVLMEAMATGRPVVATRVAGVPELVNDGVSGLLVAPGNVEELAGALDRLALDPDRRTAMGQAGRRRVEEAFDARACAAQVAAVFRDMAELELVRVRA